MVLNIPDEVKYIAAILIPMLILQWFIMNWAYNEGLYEGYNKGYEVGWKEGSDEVPILLRKRSKEFI